MTELTVVSGDLPWRDFMVDQLNKGEVIGEKGEPVEIKVNFMNTQKNPELTAQSLFESEAKKKCAIITHYGVGPLAEAMRERGFSVFGGGAIADAVQNSPSYATLQAVKQRLLITGESGGEDFVLCSTSEGLVKEWLPVTYLEGLIPGLVKTHEGMTIHKPIKPTDKHRKVIHEKIEKMCEAWDYQGFIFISDLGDGALGYFRTFGPESFLPAFMHFMKDGALKFFMKAMNSRKCISSYKGHAPATSLKATLPPYPYNRCPWVKDPEERAITERCLNQGGVGAQFQELKYDDGNTGVVWMGVDDKMKSTGAEVAILLFQDKTQLFGLLNEIDPSHRLQHKDIGA